MIVDVHTHIFPPKVRDDRDGCLRRDPTFAELYASPRAKMATAEDLLRSMDAAGVDVSVALGFAWRDAEGCARHNDYLLEAAAGSGGRIVPFCTVNPAAGETALREAERCAVAGARGLGELRPASQGWSLDGEMGDALAELAVRHGLVLLFHVTEPAGHEYPGKSGLPLAEFCRFARRGRAPGVVGAHLAGGLPFSAETAEGLEALSVVYADTAALRFLYEPAQLVSAVDALGAGRLLFGSDFPLVGQQAALEDVRGSGLDEPALASVLGGNAARLLGLPAAPSL